MMASDVMTRNVVSVAPDATVADVVSLMLDRGISGLLVMDHNGTLAGIITEGDLLRRDELGTSCRRSWWLQLIISPGAQASDFTRTHGRDPTGWSIAAMTARVSPRWSTVTLSAAVPKASSAI